MASFGSFFGRAGIIALGILGASAVVACSASGDSQSGNRRGGTGGSGGDDGTGGDGGGFPSECPANTWVCSDGVAKLCDGNGGFSEERDCATDGKVCGVGYGCVVCVPDATVCEGGMAKKCNSEGTGFEREYVCDELQGMTCDATGCHGACTPEALGDSYIGCDYYPTVTFNPVNSIFSFAVAVGNAGDKPASVLITRGGQTAASRIVAPGSLEIIKLPWVPDLKGPDVVGNQAQHPGNTRVVKNGAYRLRSTQPVTVYQFSPLEYQIGSTYSYSNDASILLPATTMTGDYTVLSWASESATGGFYAVTATQDETVVTLQGSGQIAPGAGLNTSGSGQVMLNTGDVLEVLGAFGPEPTIFNPTPPPGSDVSGTRIQANKPVQVIAGHSCALIPRDKPACDHIEETVFPVQTLGKDYLVTFPAAPGNSTSPHTIRIAAVQPNTKVRFDPPIHAEATLSPGQNFLEIPRVTQDVRITADQAILVGQYMHGAEDVPSGKGDPSLSYAIATEQFRTSYIFLAPNTYDQNFVNIVAKMGSTVTLDGQDITNFSEIGSSGYGVVRHALSKDSEVHNASSTEPFGIVTYGYGEYTSYMYPGGLDLEQINIPF